MKRILFGLYQLFIWLPLFLVFTILTAIITTIGCLLGGEKIFSYYPGMIWSKLTCIISFCPVKVKGQEFLDKKKSYVFVANHQGAYDIFLIYGYLGQPVKWVMKQSLRKIPLVGKACESAGFIFVDTSSPAAAARTIAIAEQRLKNGASVFIFPEGSRSYDGSLFPFKKGAYQMALDLKLPVVPITINGTVKVMKRNTFLLNPHKIEMIIHPPIDMEPYAAENLREAAVNIRKLMNETREIIAEDLESYVAS